MLPDILQHLSSDLPDSLQYLYVWCDDDFVVSALTTFLPQCTNLRTLHYERDRYYSVSEEEMWEAAVRRCKNLEVVKVIGEYSDVSCDRLMRVMKKLSKREGIQALKLRKIVKVDRDTGEVIKDYTVRFKHLLPALQQRKHCSLL